MRLITELKSGSERFHCSGEALGPTLQDFWRWSTSDLVSNATRGRLAEFIVASALGISIAGVRDEWGPFDLSYCRAVVARATGSEVLLPWKSHAGLWPHTAKWR